MERKWSFETLALHGGQEVDPYTLSRSVPIYQTTSYLFKDAEHAARLFAVEEEGYTYSRMMNPTVNTFEKRVALLEGGVGALATASGQAAELIAILNIAKEGDEIVSSFSLYGGTYNLFASTFKRLGITAKFVDPSDPENFRKVLTSRTKAIYAETLGNPKLDTLDIEAVADIAHSAGVPLIIDNTIPSPYLVRPIEYGADIVIHSATKFIGGHGTSIGGIIVDSGKFDWKNGKFPEIAEPDPTYHGLNYVEKFGEAAYISKARLQLMRDLGACMSPFNAFLFLQGLETLPIRMERHSQNAMGVAQFLKNHPKVSWVNYPGLPDNPYYNIAKKYFNRNLFGAMIGFGVKGGLEAGKKFVNNVKLLSHLANIGDAKSLVIHPASTTHAQLTPEEQLAAGVTPDFIRLSIGLEGIDDIIYDIDQALSKA